MNFDVFGSCPKMEFPRNKRKRKKKNVAVVVVAAAIFVHLFGI